MTPVSPLNTPMLTQVLTMTQSFEFVDFGEDEGQTRTRRRYLFTMPSDPNRCFESSNWCSRVKDAFRRHSPGIKAPCPTLLRSSSMTTALRDSRPDLAVLESAAISIAQNHSMRTQRSDVYDLRTHIRDCEEASKWCHEYANAPLEIDDVAAEEHNAGAPAENAKGPTRAAATTMKPSQISCLSKRTNKSYKYFY